MTDSHDAALREWAQGDTTVAGATELLIRTGWADRDRPWVIVDGDRTWIDFDAIGDTISGYSGGEQRLLRIAASLGGSDPIRLGDEIAGLDRNLLEHVLAAIAHVQGETSVFVPALDTDSVTIERLPVAYDWPASE